MATPNFVENFWGDKDLGFGVLLNRMRQGKSTCKEILEVISQRAAIEEEYSKKLSKLSKSLTSKDELGTLKDVLNVLKQELEQSSQSHANMASELRTKVDKTLEDFINEQSTTRKAQAKIMEKSIKTKVAQQTLVQKTRQNFEKKTKEADQLAEMQAKGGLPPKKAEEVAQKSKKALQAAEQADRDFQTSVEKLKQICTQWENDMRTTCESFQKLEEQRIEFLKTQLWTYSNILSTVYVANDESCERLRGSIEKCSVETDISLFVTERGTGTMIPQPLDYDVAREEIVSSSKVGASLTAPPAIQSLSNSRTTLPSSFDEEDVSFTPPPQNIPPKAPGGLFQVRVLYDYEPQGDEELQLRENEIVTVISDQEDPWWEGVIGNRSGMFPSNFVEKI